MHIIVEWKFHLLNNNTIYFLFRKLDSSHIDKITSIYIFVRTIRIYMYPIKFQL